MKLQNTSNIQKSPAFLHSNNEEFKKEIKKTTPFPIITKKNEILSDEFNKGGTRPLQ